MSDFRFIQNELTKAWIVLAPRRAKRPNAASGESFICPFCPGKEGENDEVFRIEGEGDDSNWIIRVLNNKYPFASIHEIIVHSPDHHKTFDELPIDQVERVLWTFRQRYQRHQGSGFVYIFNNHGIEGGESIPHPHSQLVVIPEEIHGNIPPLFIPQNIYETDYFSIFCPETSEWPDEVWFAPKRKETTFGEIEENELFDMALILQRLQQLFNLRHGGDFASNFYIYPGKNWYLRLTPRTKSLGGFEIGTGIFVNTQDPAETLQFIKEHFANKEITELREEHKANYAKTV